MDLNVVIIIAALFIGLSKGGLGGPIPVSLTAPLLSFIMPVSQAVGLLLPLLMFADLFALWMYWKQWEWYYIRLLMIPAFIGIVIGSTLLASLPDDLMRQLLGIFTLAAVVYKLASDYLTQVKYKPHEWHGVLAGLATGFGSALANMGAPPYTAYMLLQPKFEPRQFIATATLFMAIVNALKFPAFLSQGILNFQSIVTILWVLPVIPFGVWFGKKSLDWINPQSFEKLMIIMLIIAGLWLLFQPAA